MRTVEIEPRFWSWRARARDLLAAGVKPEEVDWCDVPGREAGLFGGADGEVSPKGKLTVRVPAEFLKLAETVSAHTDARRWAVLYRVAFRLTHGGERHLLKLASDEDVRRCDLWAKAVRRDIHKMHAFVRFRKLDARGDEAGEEREAFTAWYVPTYAMVRLAVPFFVKRFANMDWTIFSPDECVHWDGAKLWFAPGVAEDPVPIADAQEELWKVFYRSIFNPARLKPKMMQTEMPKKFWAQLPEAALISELMAESRGRVTEMLATPERAVKPMPKNAYLRSLHARKDEERGMEE